MGFFADIQPEKIATDLEELREKLATYQEKKSSHEACICSLQDGIQRLLKDIEETKEKIQVINSESEEKKVEGSSVSSGKQYPENTIPKEVSIDRLNSYIEEMIRKVKSLNSDIGIERKYIMIAKKNLKDHELKITRLLQLQENLKAYEESYSIIQKLGETDEEFLEKLTNVYFNPIELPFLDESIQASSQFKLINNKLKFSPRQKLHEVVDVVEANLRFNNRRGFMLYGIKGAGKSHILHAAACYYIKRKDRVIYFSNARRACNKVNWRFKLESLMVLETLRPDPDILFIDDLDMVLSLLYLHTITGFFTLLGQKVGRKLKIFIDQVDSLPDSETQLEKDCPEYLISRRQFEYYIAQTEAVFTLCATANDINSYRFSDTGMNDDIVYIPILSGYNSVEYDKWFDRSIQSLRAEGKPKSILDYFLKSKDMMEFITGANPLYLSRYLKVIKPTYEETLNNLLNDREICAMRQKIANFCIAISEVVITEVDKKTLKRYILSCVRNETINDSDALRYVFLEYFYVLGEWSEDEKVNEREGCWSSALAAHYLSKIMSLDKDVNWSLEGEYERQQKIKTELAENLEKNGIKQIKEKGISACELTVERNIKVFDNGYMAQIELFDKGPEVLYFRPVLQLPGAVDGLILTKDKIIGVKYTISPNSENPFQAFIRTLKQIPFFKANNQKYSIYFCWMLTSNCTGMIFNQVEKTIEGITFNVRAERFGEEVEEMRQQKDKKNEREIAMLVANMTLTLNPGPKRKNSNNNGVVAKRARQ